MTRHGRLAATIILLATLTVTSVGHAQFAITPGVGVGTLMGVNGTATPNVVGCPVANNPVAVMFDVSNPMGMIYYSLWNQPPGVLLSYSAPTWASKEIGQLFGVALGGANTSDVFVSATAVYGTDSTCNPNYYFAKDSSGNALTGAVWRLNPLGGLGSGGSMDYELVANLPASRGSLGSLAFNPDANVIYVTNFVDGRIYALVAPGNTSTPYTPNQTTWLDTYPSAPAPFLQPGDVDSGVLPLGANQLAAYGDRKWGLAYNRPERRVYYSALRVENRNANKNNSLGINKKNNEVWSIAVDVVGKFIPSSARLELKVPFYPGPVGTLPSNFFSFPVSDIAFSDDGKTMAIAERGDLLGIPPQTVGAPSTGAHFARTMTFVLGVSGGTRTWFSNDPNLFGTFNGAQSAQTNSGGGVDLVPMPGDMFLWSTTNSFNSRAFIGNAPPTGQVHVYGVQGMRYSDAKTRPLPDPLNLSTNPPKAFFVDFDGNWSTFAKHLIGEFKVRRSNAGPPTACDCATIESYSIRERTLTARVCAPTLNFAEIRVVIDNVIVTPTSITPPLPLSGPPPYCVNIQVQLPVNASHVHVELASEANPDTLLSQCCRTGDITLRPTRGATTDPAPRSGQP